MYQWKVSSQLCTGSMQGITGVGLLTLHAGSRELSQLVPSQPMPSPLQQAGLLLIPSQVSQPLFSSLSNSSPFHLPFFHLLHAPKFIINLK